MVENSYYLLSKRKAEVERKKEGLTEKLVSLI